MKAFKKQIFIFLFLLIGVFFVGIDGVSAEEGTYLYQQHFTLQCIYTDGGLYTNAKKNRYC